MDVDANSEYHDQERADENASPPSETSQDAGAPTAAESTAAAHTPTRTTQTLKFWPSASMKKRALRKNMRPRSSFPSRCSLIHKARPPVPTQSKPFHPPS